MMIILHHIRIYSVCDLTKTRFDGIDTLHCTGGKKILSNDQEMAQTENNYHSKHKGGKN